MRREESVGSFIATIAAVTAMEAEAESFKDEIKVLVLRQVTVEGIDTLLKHHLYQRRIRPVIEFGGYGTMTQDVLAADGPVARMDPALIVLALSLDELDRNFGAPGWRYDAARAELAGLLELLIERTHATIAVHTFIAPLWPEMGLVLDSQGNDLGSQVAELNRYVTEVVRSRAPRLVLMDWEQTLRRLGADAALNERGRYMWRAPFRHSFLDAWAHQLTRVVAALKGRAKKVLVLDCDDTLWGGVIGEEGLDGIELDDHQYPGRAYVDFQTTVLHLVQRGVLVTLCSKNNEADVFSVLDAHPTCRLKRAHLSGWRINWKDKATNIAELADELNLGLDAFVFVDNSTVECELVRQVLPQVTVIQVPGKLHELPSLLLQGGLFDTLSLTREDKGRAQLYQEEGLRKSARIALDDIDEYLKSLETKAKIHRATAAEVPRIAQLTQKTNQFNLTTRRYTDQDIQILLSDPGSAVYSLSASDRFGALGLVGVLIAKLDAGVIRVDSFLMSCRALGRRLEIAMVEQCLNELSTIWPVDRCEAEYIETTKNSQVADFWPRMGFATVAALGKRNVFARAVTTTVESEPTHVFIDQD